MAKGKCGALYPLGETACGRPKGHRGDHVGTLRWPREPKTRDTSEDFDGVDANDRETLRDVELLEKK